MHWKTLLLAASPGDEISSGPIDISLEGRTGPGVRNGNDFRCSSWSFSSKAYTTNERCSGVSSSPIRKHVGEWWATVNSSKVNATLWSDERVGSKRKRSRVFLRSCDRRYTGIRYTVRLYSNAPVYTLFYRTRTLCYLKSLRKVDADRYWKKKFEEMNPRLVGPWLEFRWGSSKSDTILLINASGLNQRSM